MSNLMANRLGNSL